MKKFDFIIGNPPYQMETESKSTRKPPIYHVFMDEAFKISKKTLLITPARFLFNAGYTPKSWNRKMLNDCHFKVCKYEEISEKIFKDTQIKGGIVITYRDNFKTFEPIEIFTKYSELNIIVKKIKRKADLFLSSIIFSPLAYSVSKKMKQENPELVDRLRTSAFKTLSSIFFDTKPDDDLEYILFHGLENSIRVKKYIRKDYIRGSDDVLDNYNVLLSKAIGSGKFGERISETIIAGPGEAYLQTFIGIGAFKHKIEAENVEKYLKTKLCRAMLGVLKITQDNPGPKWKYVPLQDFTSNSDIDWSKSIAEIDQQLYEKYDLNNEEINFIEKNVQEMV